jgi:hypothetical protein
MNRLMYALGTMLLLLAVLVGIAWAASNDNNVEWNGVGHQKGANLGGNPSYPYFSNDASDPNNQKAVIRLRVYQYDITSANVVWTTNASASQESDWTYTSMSWEANVQQSGTWYDSWKATLPTQKNTTVYYKIQVNDGGDTDWVTRSGEGNTIVDDNTTWGISSTALFYQTGPTAITLRGLTVAPALPAALPAAGAVVALGGLGVGGLVAWRRRKG